MDTQSRHCNRLNFLIIGIFFSIAECKSDAKLTNSFVQNPINDLQSASSSYSHQYYNWGGNYPGGYNVAVTGNGLIDDNSRFGNQYNSIGGNPYNTYSRNSYNPGNFGQDSDKTFNYDDGYHNFGGYGGYGGNGGNGGLNSYVGYNNPYYQESNHLGFGYYNKNLGYGNIYSSGVTPNLVTGYRGYSRR